MKAKMLTSGDLLIFLVVVAFLLLFFYRYVYGRERRQARLLTAKQTFWLWALRIMVAVLALIALARPAITRSKTKVRLPVVAMLIDTSASMNFPTTPNNPLVRRLSKDEITDRPRRLQAAEVAVQRLQERLTRTHRVRLYTFSDMIELLRELPHRSEEDDVTLTRSEVFTRTRRGGQPEAVRAKGEYSYIGSAVKSVLTRSAGDKLAGIVIFSDFQQTGGPTTYKEARDAARDAGVPVHTVAEGTEYPLRDLRIDEVSVGHEASLGDVLTFGVTITNDISAELDTKLYLFEKSAEEDATKRDKKYQQVAVKNLTLSRGRNYVSIATIPSVTRRRRFLVKLPLHRPELDESNNEKEKVVHIVKRSLRVLLIAGRPSREYFYMVPALLRDPIVKLSCFLQSADVDYVQQGNVSIDRLPRTVREWTRFDVCILHDVNPNGLTTQQIAGLENMINKGGGLIIIAGRNHGLAKFVQVHTTRVRGMLPVEIDRNLYPDYDRFFDKPFKARRTAKGRDHSIMFVSANEEENEQIWARFPQFYWHHPVLGPSNRATVLLEREGPGEQAGAPLMTVQIYGEGTVFFSAIDSMWRWRYPYESFEYDRFWTRVIRYLGEVRLHGVRRQVSLEVAPRTCNPGEEVDIALKILDPAMVKQLEGERGVFVSVTSEKKVKDMVLLSPPRPGAAPVYRGSYRARAVGNTSVRARQVLRGADSDQKPLFDVTTSFEVALQSLEKQNTRADLEAAKDLANKTNGKYFNYRNIRDVDSLDALVAAIPTDKQVLRTEIMIEVWDGFYFLALFLVLISAEWCLRKLWGLL